MKGRRKRLVFGSRNVALTIGYGGILIGSYALWEAYESRGKQRPFLVKFLPGA